MRFHRARTLLLLVGIVAPASGIIGQTPVPVRELSAPEARSTDHFGVILNVRPMAGGRVLVNDTRNRQLVALDANLAHRSVVIDSASVGGQSYGPRPTPLIPYLADSSLFVDGASFSLIVISPTGAITRVMSAPKPTDLRLLASSASGVDAKGNLVYRGAAPRGDMNTPDATANLVAALIRPDSLPVVRANFEKRTVDTIGRVKNTGEQRLNASIVDGLQKATIYVNPLSNIDEWAVLSDGSVAFVRGHDYHVDILRPDGTTVSTPKLAFDWKRLTDRDRQLLIDSTQRVLDERLAAAKAALVAANGSTGADANAADKAMAEGLVNVGFVMRTLEGGGAPSARPAAIKVDIVNASEITDYWPPIRAGAAKADLDGNVWVLPTTSAQSRKGELVYDVINNRGVLTQRVRLPLGRSIAGFGHGGTVYLTYMDGEAGWILERTKVVNAAKTTP